MRLWLFLAAVNGLLAMTAGAYAAHGLDDSQSVMLLEQASRYQMTHALALIGVAWLAGQWPHSWPVRVAGTLFAVGTALFCGALSLHALLGVHVNQMAPAGGIVLMGGWASLAWTALRPFGSPEKGDGI